MEAQVAHCAEPLLCGVATLWRGPIPHGRPKPTWWMPLAGPCGQLRPAGCWSCLGGGPVQGAVLVLALWERPRLAWQALSRGRGSDVTRMAKVPVLS